MEILRGPTLEIRKNKTTTKITTYVQYSHKVALTPASTHQPTQAQVHVQCRHAEVSRKLPIFLYLIARLLQFLVNPSHSQTSFHYLLKFLCNDFGMIRVFPCSFVLIYLCSAYESPQWCTYFHSTLKDKLIKIIQSKAIVCEQIEPQPFICDISLFCMIHAWQLEIQFRMSQYMSDLWRKFFKKKKSALGNQWYITTKPWSILDVRLQEWLNHEHVHVHYDCIDVFEVLVGFSFPLVSLTAQLHASHSMPISGLDRKLYAPSTHTPCHSIAP